VTEQPLLPPGDPTAVILARMEVKLDNALTEQSRHGTTLDRHDRLITDNGNRITALETRAQAEDGHAVRRISDRAVYWAMISALAVFVGSIVTVIIAVRH
jgi:hypothetical protein